jgi:hypothetical protein
LIALPPVQKLKSAVRFVVVLIATLVPAGVAVGLAQRSFAAATDESSAYGAAGTASDAPAFGGTPSSQAEPGSGTEPSPPRSTDTATSPRDPRADEEPKRSAPIDPGADSRN